MPQLVKGGKHVFGWSVISEEGRIMVPPEACQEYNYKFMDKIIIISGSQTSGGFSLIKVNQIAKSFLSNLFNEFPDLKRNDFPKNQIIKSGKRKICWVLIDENCSISLSNDVLNQFDTRIGQKILAARGSGLGLSFIAKGPIYKEALIHEELGIF